MLISPPVLAFPDHSKPNILDSDASDGGIGSVLSQEQDNGLERVIAYGSRVLSKTERNYCYEAGILSSCFLHRAVSSLFIGKAIHFTFRP